VGILGGFRMSSRLRSGVGPTVAFLFLGMTACVPTSANNTPAGTGGNQSGNAGTMGGAGTMGNGGTVGSAGTTGNGGNGGSGANAGTPGPPGETPGDTGR